VTVTLDTNILVYATDNRYPQKQETARDIVVSGRSIGGALGLQVFGEFYGVATGKLRQPAAAAATLANSWMRSFRLFGASAVSTRRAFAVAETGTLSFWDANLLCAAEEAGCTHLLTEDMQDGYRLGRIEVVHAFAGDDLSDRARRLLGL